MATAKIVLRKKPRKDGSYPLALRITKDRKTSFIHLGYHCFEKDWDAKAQRVRKSHPNSARLNAFITKKLVEANDVMLDADTQHKETPSRAIKHKIKPAADARFFAQARLYLRRLEEAGNYNVQHVAVSKLRIFQEYLLGTDAVASAMPAWVKAKHPPRQGLFSGSDVAFAQIDVRVLTQFTHYLRGPRKLAESTIAAYLETIQAVFRQAIREDVIDEKHLPFGKGKIKIKSTPSQKVGLTREDVEKLETVELIHPAHIQARDAWLMSFYFAGMRASDVFRLRWSQFRDGRLYYVMGKNSKPVSLKVPEKARAILERYKSPGQKPDDFVFGYLKGYERVTDQFALKRRIAALVSRCDSYLKRRVAPAAGIEGKCSMHIARHTFATLAADKISIQMLQKLYRHSDIKTTIAYQANFINRDADEALDAVLGE